MYNLPDYLNVRHSLRNLSDQEFELAVPELAKQLVNVSYIPTYNHIQLWDDWRKLCKWRPTAKDISSTSRIGLKLCEHFFPNFYEIVNSRGQSFSNLWTAENLEKILRWNRKSHSTPYLSEIKRGIYFCCGLTKNTMYRPQMMKLACAKYQPETVLDPCAGWGGRMLGAVAAGCRYIAFEPNTQTYKNLVTMSDYLGINNSVTLICDDARNMDKYKLPTVGMVLTSPPYFDLEIYCDEGTQSITNTQSYEQWSDKFLREIIQLGINHLAPGGVSCWNVGKVRNRDMNDDVLKYHTQLGFFIIDELSVVSSKRQSNQTQNSNNKSADTTVVYKKT